MKHLKQSCQIICYFLIYTTWHLTSAIYSIKNLGRMFLSMTIKSKQANQHKTTTTACDRETKNKFSKICSPIISRIPCMFWIIYLILCEKSFSWINEEFCRASIYKKKYNEISSLTDTFENLSFLWKMYSFSEHAYEHLGYASAFFYILKILSPKNYSSNAGKSHIHMRKCFLTQNFL